MSVITALDNSVTCTVHQRWTRNVSANAPKQQWWFVLSIFPQVFYWKTYIYIITFCKTTYVYIPRTFITLTLVKNMGVHAGHKTHPAVISTRLKPVRCMVPPPKDLMRSLEFLWAFRKFPEKFSLWPCIFLAPSQQCLRFVIRGVSLETMTAAAAEEEKHKELN